ncbi:MAG: hypothetical protein MJ025_04635 [Victivallaceae bacterium]|nr:hypothetical protein [Victivallaceae bacterium]
MDDQKIHYKIRFVEGELAGRSFALDDAGMRIGKAKDNDIRPGGADILPYHVTLLPQSASGGVLLNFEKNAKISLDGMRLVEDRGFIVLPGMKVTLGSNLTFVIEESADIPAAPAVERPPVSDDSETVDDAPTAVSAETPAPAAAGDEPASNDTRYASDEELKELRRLSRRRRLGKSMTAIIGIMILLVLATICFIQLSKMEKTASWPGAESGEFNDGTYDIKLPNGALFRIYYPLYDGTTMDKDGDFFTVRTAVGRNYDVPINISFVLRDVKDGFRVTRQESLNAMIDDAANRYGVVVTNGPSLKFYLPNTCGYPYNHLEFLRADAKTGMLWHGYASYLRYQDKELLLLREVPSRYFAMAKPLLDENDFFDTKVSMADYYWEVPEKRLDMPIDAVVNKAFALFSKGNVALMSWKDADLVLRTLLCYAYENHDTDLITVSEAFWKVFRDSQQQWYMGACLTYAKAEMDEDIATQRSIRNECLRNFSFDSDCRRTKVMENIWVE